MSLKYNAMSQIMSWTNRERKFQRAIVSGSEYSWVLKFQGEKVLGPIRSGERKFQGARRPGSERARVQKFQGDNWPCSYWLIRSRERIGPGAKRLWILYYYYQYAII